MKPLNLDKSGCTNTSSNCVVWQGPDIACISLCKGDSITDVVYKMATELCIVMDTFNLDNYDLGCFGSGPCNPADFKALMQLVINKICFIQDCSGCKDDCYPCGTTPVVMGASAKTASLQSYSLPGDTIVPIAPVFYYTNQFGDLVTMMPLTDYVIAIGNKVNILVTTITAIQGTLIQYNTRIEALEQAAPPVFVIPTITPVCVLPQVSTTITLVLASLEQQFCQLRTATGTPNQIFTSLGQQPAGLANSPSLANPLTVMSALPGFVSTVQNESDTISNIWVTLSDMRLAVQNIVNNYIPSVCSSIGLTMFGTYDSGSNSVTVYVNGTIPMGFVNTYNAGTPFTITDANNASTTTNIDILSIINTQGGFNITLGNTLLNGLTNLSILAQPNFTNTASGSQCQSVLSYTIVNQGSCPVVTYTPATTSIGFAFTSDANTQTYTVEIWDAVGLAVISSQSFISTSVNTYTGSFVGLTTATTYKLRVTIDIANVITTCAFTVETTL